MESSCHVCNNLSYFHRVSPQQTPPLLWMKKHPPTQRTLRVDLRSVTANRRNGAQMLRCSTSNNQRRTTSVLAKSCIASGESEVEFERELKEVVEEGKEWREMDKCRGETEGVGIVNLLECLEREAIMGEDEGKNPGDYNRRAVIFDKSSKVFQAMKNNQAP